MGVGRIWMKVNKLKLKPELHNGNGEGRGLLFSLATRFARFDYFSSSLVLG